MASELTYVLINPYTLIKSRTGGVISRIISRTGLEMVGARMFGPSQELVDRYAAIIRADDSLDKTECDLIANHVQAHYGPNPKTGRPRRVLMLLFEGDDAIAKVRAAVGGLRQLAGSGETVRDTFGDLVLDENDRVQYVEPAVTIGRNPETVEKVLKLWSDFSETDGGLIEQADDVPEGTDVQRTLVIIKPDNFRFPSSRPGNIIDLFSASGLRIIGAKLHRMSVAEGEEFYGPVQEVLRTKLVEPSGERAAKVLEQEFGFSFSAKLRQQLGEVIGPAFGDEQFYQILKFMTGRSPSEVVGDEKFAPGPSRCLVLIYKGEKAVEKIRKILGPTDPLKAGPGSVRKEFGKDIMINAAHASDSPESVVREMGIVKPEADTIRPLYEKYFKR